MAVLSADSFNRANSTSSLGSTDGAGSLDPKTWTVHTGTCGINSNQAYCSALGGGGTGFATVDLSTGDVDLSLTFNAYPGFPGQVFRYSNATNYWTTFTGSPTGSSLYKVVAGAFTLIGSNHTGVAAGDVLRVTANGNTITFYRNGVQLETTTDSFNAAATRHGLYFGSTSDRLDDFSVSNFTVTTTVTGTQATETDTGTSGTLVSVAAPTPVTPTLTYSLDTPSAATAAGYMVLG